MVLAKDCYRVGLFVPENLGEMVYVSVFSGLEMVFAVGCAVSLFLPLFQNGSVYGKGLQCHNSL